MAETFIKFLGARGSRPMAGIKYRKYGGDTSCVFVSLGKQLFLFDAGSGLINLSKDLLENSKNVNVLFSHTHIDHITGLPFWDVMYDESMNIDIYGAKRDGLDIQQQINCLMSPPLWPVGFEAFFAKINCHTAKREFYIGDVKVSTIDAKHPGGCLMYRLDYNDLSIVYATDNEIEQQASEQFIEFASDCTLFICDGQYSEQEYQNKKGFGHTRWDIAVDTALKIGCKQFAVFHHDPKSNDDLLDEVQQKITEISPFGCLAKEGMVIYL